MTLEDGIAALGLALPAGAADKLAAYLALLAKWNRVYNLTAIRDDARMLTHHLFDSLAVLPGLVLAICRPELQVTSIEASQKKAAFQQQAKIELGLANVSIHCGRVEDVAGTFDGAISRAFSELADFVRLAGHLAPRLYAMKGQHPQQEIERLPAGWQVLDSTKLAVPGLAAERHLIVLGRT